MFSLALSFYSVCLGTIIALACLKIRTQYTLHRVALETSVIQLVFYRSVILSLLFSLFLVWGGEGYKKDHLYSFNSFPYKPLRLCTP